MANFSGTGIILKGSSGTAKYKFSYSDDLVLMNAAVGAEGALNAAVEQAEPERWC